METDAEISTVMAEEVASTVVEGMTSTEGQEKCIRQLVQSVATNVKFHSNQLKANRFTAESASKSTSQKEGQEETTREPVLLSNSKV